MSDFGGVHRYNVTGLYHDIWGLSDGEAGRGGEALVPSGGKDRDQGGRDCALAGILSGRREAGVHFLRQCGAQRAASGEHARGKGIRAGLLELQTLWPFPANLVRSRTEQARHVYVVEMNMGQVCAQVRQAVPRPDDVFLINRVDGQLITPTDIGNVMRVVEGRGF